jgi:hypothetical protein
MSDPRAVLSSLLRATAGEQKTDLVMVAALKQDLSAQGIDKRPRTRSAPSVHRSKARASPPHGSPSSRHHDWREPRAALGLVGSIAAVVVAGLYRIVLGVRDARAGMSSSMAGTCRSQASRFGRPPRLEACTAAAGGARRRSCHRRTAG